MFYAIPNLSSHSASPQSPWEFTPNIPPGVQRDKLKFISWCAEAGTRHCMYSAYEGLTPSIRVGKDNSPVYLHALVLDYDSVVDAGMIESIMTRSKFDHLPNWYCQTFSGGARLIWEFEAPLLLGNSAFTKAFLKQVKKFIRPGRLLPGLDEEAFMDPNKYYEVGKNWQRLSEQVLPETLIQHWAFLAGGTIKTFTTEADNIPFAAVAMEVIKRFPGKWPGTFEVGARGPRFWDNSADNDRAAVVREGGMQCFTGDTAFMTWRQVLGDSFTEKYAALRVGNLIKGCYFDGRGYWKVNEDGPIVTYAKDDFRLHVRVSGNLNNSIAKGDTVSEVDKVLHYIQENCRIDGAMPFVHREPGIVHYLGKKYINSSTARCIEPCDQTNLGWGEGFPWLSSFFTGLFDTDDQLEYFFGWLKFFYENAYEKDPKKGQAIFIAGEPNQGKTLLSTGIISRMVGGHQDASQFLLGEIGPYTDHIVASPLLTVDDSSPARDSKSHAKFSAAIKQLVANQHITHLRKYHDAGQVSWFGRIVVTCNTDVESLRILPSVEINNLDKLSFFRMASRQGQFPGNVSETLERELPFFCRCLLEWQIPEHVQGDARFGVKEYHNPFMLQTARTGESSSAFQELLNMFRDTCRKNREKVWEGSTSKLLADLSVLPEHEILARQFSDLRRLGRILSKLSTQPDSGVSIDESVLRGRSWIIDCVRD